MMKQMGANLPPPTVNDWFKDTADLLRPLYYRFRELVLATDYIQVDETTGPGINNEKHKTSMDTCGWCAPSWTHSSSSIMTMVQGHRMLPCPY